MNGIPFAPRIWLAATGFLGLACGAQADVYTEPVGFSDHFWGDTLAGTKGLILWHVNTAAGSRGKVTSSSFQCVQNMSRVNTCDPALSQTEQLQQGEGSPRPGGVLLRVGQESIGSRGH